MESGRLLTRAVVWGLLLAPALLIPRAIRAQNIVVPGMLQPAQDAATEAAPGQNIFAPADRTSLLWLSDARQLLEQQRYAEAVRLLGAILEAPEDYFFQNDRSSSVHRSLKAEAQALLGGMPRQGRDLYELQYGARARKMLAEAARAGDTARLAEVSRRFFHTLAGYEATLLLGLHYLDHGSPLAGALTLRRLQVSSPEAARFEPTLSLAVATCWMRAGMPDNAQEVLLDLKKRLPKANVEVAGKQLPLFDKGSDSLEWLIALVGQQPEGGIGRTEQWAMFRGNAARNASTFGSGPLLSMRWQVPTYDNPYVQAMLDQIRENHRQRDMQYQFLPALHPLVVDDVVLMRTSKNLLAVDFGTGKRIWEVPVDDPFEGMMEISSEEAMRNPHDLGMPLGLEARLWSDTTYGTLSSDGQYVFAVEDLPLALGDAPSRHLIIQGQRVVSSKGPKSHNRLAAYHIRTGKLQWHIGGSPSEFQLPEAGTFFLGPPLPLMGELFVLGESKGEIRLLALDAKTGKVQWTQQLAVVDQDILTDPLRRLAGASPSYADGVLVCPTANRSVVAVELATRSLLWGYTYPEDPAISQRHMMFFGMRSVMNADSAARWPDATATISDGRVLVAPPDSAEIHCLSLIDGKLLWKEPRQDDVYLACAHGGKAVLVGRSQVRTLNLEDGKPGWNGQTVSFPAGSTPSGWGFRAGNRYFLPLSSAEVMSVDLDSGKPDHTFKARGETVPGNLVCYRGHVVSQRADAVEVFYQLDALRKQIDQRLTENPKDAEALSLRGEILWDDGNLEDAIGSFRTSLEILPDPRTRDLLREALFDGLRSEFPVYRQRDSEIQALIDRPEHRATYLRLMAAGCEGAGEFAAALGHYRELIDLDRQHRGMEQVDESLVVRRDRWIRTQLASLREKAPAEGKAGLDQLAEAELEAAAAEGTTEALQHFLDYFGAIPSADRARRTLQEKLGAAGRMLESELLLEPRLRSEDRAVVGAALAEQAESLRKKGAANDAAICYARLRNEFAEVVCLGGKTGRQVVDSLPKDDPVRGILDSDSEWPIGKVEVQTSSQPNAPPSSYNRSPLEYLGSPAPFFTDLNVEIQQNPQVLVARDGLGNVRWQLPLEGQSDRGRFATSAAFMRVVAHGHLLVVSMGQKIMAVDALSLDEKGSPKILWSHDLEKSRATDQPPLPLQAQVIRIGGGFQRLQLARSADNPITVPEAVSSEALCYQEFRDLVAVDPLTGERLWVRHDIDPSCTVFGDHEYIFVVPPGESTAMVLKASDGSLLDKRPVAPQRIATLGRRTLAVLDLPDGRLLQMIDAWTSNEVWPGRKFATDTRLCLVDHEYIGALEPDGHFQLIALDDGRSIVDVKLPPQPAVSEIHVFQSPQYITLITNSAERQAGNVRTHALHPIASARIIEGRVWGFDRQGKLLWPEPVVVEDQHLPLRQPGRIPVISFACMVQERRPNSPTQTKTAVLFVDKRTGWKHSEEFENTAANSFQLVGDSQKKSVEVQLQRNSVTLKFTDQPLDPEPQKADSEKPGAVGAAFKALGKAAENAIGIPFPLALPPLDREELPAVIPR